MEQKFILSSFPVGGNKNATPRWEHRLKTSMKFYAHTAEDDQGNRLPECKWQPLSEHLRNVANLAKEFAAPLGLAAEAELAGLMTMQFSEIQTHRIPRHAN